MANFIPLPDVPYKYDYADIFKCIANGKIKAVPTYRELCKKDLFFLLYFGLQRTEINDPDNPRKTFFIVKAIREIEEDHWNTLDLWAREHYKMLCNNIRVLTPSGYRLHGDLRPGDFVYSPEGKPVRILAVTGTMLDPEMYHVTFRNGQRSYMEVLHAGGDHLWDVEYFSKRRTPTGRVGRITATLSTKDLIERTHRQRRVKNPLWYRVKYHDPLEGEHIDLPVPPYTLGAWLGDGTSSNGAITNASNALWQRIQVDGYEISHDRTPQRNNTQLRTVYELADGLKKLGLWGGSCRSKFIPEEYFGASKQQRIELLQGLMDTDGSVAARGNIVFTSTSTALTSGVVRLLRTLGIAAQIKEYSITHNGAPYPYYRVSFVHRDDVAPFTLQYHIKKLGAAHTQYWYITNIERAETVPAQCIQVEGGRYLAGEFNIPTHNSTILTYALPIQEIILNCEERIGIFSHTRPIAKGFLRQIKLTLESPIPIKKWFPDIFHRNPKKEAQKWSEDDGLIVKRKSNAKEASFEAWGLVDGQPTSKHYTIRIYDDVVTGASVTNPEQIKKTKDAFELSQSLGTDGGKKRVNGTHYSFADLYTVLKKKGDYKVREKAATDDGTPTGNPVFLSAERLDELRKDQGPYVFGCQQLLNPLAYDEQRLKTEWLRYWPARTYFHLNLYIIVDPASEKKKANDYTSMFVVGLGEDENYYIVTMIRDRLNLTEKGNILFDLHRTYRPLAVGYEKYGMQSDIAHYEYKMEHEKYHFKITPLAGPVGQYDRILGMVPLFESNRIYLPDRCFRKDYEGKEHDLVKVFVEEEYWVFPFAAHQDMLDCLSRIKDPDFPMRFPQSKRHSKPRQKEADNAYDPLE